MKLFYRAQRILREKFFKNDKLPKEIKYHRDSRCNNRGARIQKFVIIGQSEKYYIITKIQTMKETELETKLKEPYIMKKQINIYEKEP